MNLTDHTLGHRCLQGQTFDQVIPISGTLSLPDECQESDSKEQIIFHHDLYGISMYLVKTPISLPQTVVQVTVPISAPQMGPHSLHTYAGVASRITTIHLLQQVQHLLLHNQRCDLEAKIIFEDTVIPVTVGNQAHHPQALNLIQNLGLVTRLPVLQQHHVRRLRPISKDPPLLFMFPSPLHRHLYRVHILRHHNEESKISLFPSDLPTTKYLSILQANHSCREEHVMFQQQATRA
jgi:hypothetical protein